MGKKLISRKNKKLIDIPYYDVFVKDPKRKERYFKRYTKNYAVSKIIRKLHKNKKNKDITLLLETDKFYLLNNIYCVLNLESIKKVLRENYPTIDKILKRNEKECNKPQPSLLVSMSFTFLLTTINFQDQKSTYIVGSKHEIFTNLNEFCNFCRNFIFKNRKKCKNFIFFAK